MGQRRALIVEKDGAAARRWIIAFDLLGCETTAVTTRKAAIARLDEIEPDLVVAAVEKPHRAGFKLFSDLRRSRSTVPVILMTATLPMSEMMLHQKLRLHADAYLDKRKLRDLELLSTLNKLLELKLDTEELENLAHAVAERIEEPKPVGRDASASPRPDELPTFDTTEERSEIDESLEVTLASLAMKPAVDSDPVTDSEPSVLDEDDSEEVGELKRRLDAAESAAAASPFSEEFLQLRDKADRDEKRQRTLAAELDVMRRQLEEAREALDSRAQDLADIAQHRRDAELEVGRTRRQLEHATQALEREQDAVRALEVQIADELSRAAEVKEAERAKCLALEADLEEARAAQARERERLEGEQSRLLEIQKDKHRTAIEEVGRRYAQRERELLDGANALREQLRQAAEQQRHELATLRSELERERDAARQTLTEREVEIEQASTRRLQLEAALADRTDALTRAEERGREAEARIDAIHAGHSQAIEALERSTTERLREAETQIETARAELNRTQARSDEKLAERAAEITTLTAQLEAEGREAAEALAAAKSEHTRMLASLRDKHGAALQQLEADVAERERLASLRVQELQTDLEEATTRAEQASARQQRLDEELERGAERQREAVASLRVEHRSALADLRSFHERQLERVESEARTRLEETRERLESDRDETERRWRERLEALESEHAAEIAELRSRHREELAAMSRAWEGVDASAKSVS